MTKNFQNYIKLAIYNGSNHHIRKPHTIFHKCLTGSVAVVAGSHISGFCSNQITNMWYESVS